MNIQAELRRLSTSHTTYAAVRIAVAIVVPAMVLAHFGLLQDWFLFPLGTSMIGLSDMTGPYHRRRNSLTFSVFLYSLIAVIGTLCKDFVWLQAVQLIVWGMTLSLLAVYGQRFAALGGLGLVTCALFLDGHFVSRGYGPLLNHVIFFAGCAWYVLIFLLLAKLQPYKLAFQLIGENFIQLAEYLDIKAKFYAKDADIATLHQEVIRKQIKIKNLQEETREVLFKTRLFVRESTTASRILVVLFLNTVDLFEKLLTTDQDYEKLHERFDESRLLEDISQYLQLLAADIRFLGISVQSGQHTLKAAKIEEDLSALLSKYQDFRERNLSSDNIENFMMLRLVLSRITDAAKDISSCVKVYNQDQKLAKSLSTGIDYEKFVTSQEKLNRKVLLDSLSLNSGVFRNAVRTTIALLLGFAVAKIPALEIHRSYWILITIIAIIRPAYSTTKHRNLLRIYGTISGAVAAYLLLYFVHQPVILFVIFISSMVLCFSLLKEHYAAAVFFMTVYLFITFDFLSPGNINLLFKERLIDTLIGGLIVFAVSYLILPMWERLQAKEYYRESLEANVNYLRSVLVRLENKVDNEEYRLDRKAAIIHLANFSDNFQRMLSDPKNQQHQMEFLHQLVTTSHLVTAYTASLSQYSLSKEDLEVVNFKDISQKILQELELTLDLVASTAAATENIAPHQPLPETDHLDQLLEDRKEKLQQKNLTLAYVHEKPSHITELKNIRDLLELLYDVVHEQRKVTQKFLRAA